MREPLARGVESVMGFAAVFDATDDIDAGGVADIRGAKDTTEILRPASTLDISPRVRACRHRLTTTPSGSALVEVCVAVAMLCSVALMAAAAQSQSLILLRNAVEYRRAAWIVTAAAESLRGGDLTDRVEREWDGSAAAALDDGHLKIRGVSADVDAVEVSWRAGEHAGRAWCADQRACVTVFVAAGRRAGGQPW